MPPGILSQNKLEENKRIAETGIGGSYLSTHGILKKPSLKMKKFVRRAVETCSPIQAVKEVYGPKKYAVMKNHATQLMNNPGIKILMEKMIPDSLVLDTVKAQLNAETIKGKDDMWVPDNMARLKAADISLKLKGAYPTDALKLNVGGGSQINFIVSKMDPSDEVDVKELVPVEENNGTQK